MSPIITYGALLVAILLEVIGTSLLNVTQQFTRPLPTIAMALCYGGAFYFLTIAMKTLPVGIVYAIWSGIGIVLIAIVGLVAFGQKLDMPAIIGLGLIIAGVLVINLLSKTTAH